MKTLLIACMLAASSAASIQASHAAEMIYNGGFDNSTAGWELQNWGGGSINNYTENAGAPHNNVMRCDTASLPTPGTALLAQHVTLKKGRTYQYSIDVNAASGVKLQLFIRSNDARMYYASPVSYTVQGNGAWQHIVLKGGFATDVNDAFVGFYFDTPGTVRLDNISLTDITPAVPALTSMGIIPSTYFGMHINCLGCFSAWPQVNEGMLRLWDCGCTWDSLQPQDKDHWSWGQMDYYVNTAAANNCPIIYTLGEVPQWARTTAGDPSSPPAQAADWENYVYTVAQRYAGKIKYFEMWNEVNQPEFYSGDQATMAYLTMLTRRQLNRIDPNIVLLSPSVTDGAIGWLDIYLTEITKQQQANPSLNLLSGIAWHHYFSLTPEDDFPLIAGVKSVMTNHGYSSLPIYKTEGALNQPAGGATPDQLRASVARELLTQWTQGIRNFNYYTWDIYTPLCQPAPNQAQPNAGGIAYREVAKWLTGATMTSLTVDAKNTWQISITRPGSYTGRIIWQASNQTIATNLQLIDASMTQYRTLEGNTSPITSANVIIGPKPILLENKTPGAASPPSVPASVRALPGSAKVVLTWTGDAGATFSVYRGTSAGGEAGTPIISGLQKMSCTDTSASNGTTYFYKIRATANALVSGYSAEVSAKPAPIPATPTGITATPGAVGSKTITIKWALSAGATIYDIYRASTASGTYAIVGSAVTGSYANSGLTAGAVYYYKVTAKNSGGASAQSAAVSAKAQ